MKGFMWNRCIPSGICSTIRKKHQKRATPKNAIQKPGDCTHFAFRHRTFFLTKPLKNVFWSRRGEICMV